jgi:hypothetical protein
MDFAEILAISVSTGLVSIPLAAYLGKVWLENQISKDQSVWDAKIKKGVESFLADQAAQRAYDWEARKRLYEAIGPLRFQLLLACRDLQGRVNSHGRRESYSTNIDEYYGQSTLYRLLRPVTIGLLIERQMAFADFAVDPAAIELIRFNYLLKNCLSGELLVQGHTQIDWDHQKQHAFSQSIEVAGGALVVEQAGCPARVMRFDEFEDKVTDPEFLSKLEPFPSLFQNFSPKRKPLYWLRLVACANLCRSYLADHGKVLRIGAPTLDIRALLTITGDAEILSALDTYTARCAELLDQAY